MFNCPNRRPPMDAGAGRAFFAIKINDCDEVAWNEQSRKYLWRGNLDGCPVQMLINTGCNQTVMSARLVDPAKVQPQEKVPILCAHGDTVRYPLATVKLQAGPWERESRVVVALNLNFPWMFCWGRTSVVAWCRSSGPEFCCPDMESEARKEQQVPSRDASQPEADGDAGRWWQGAEGEGGQRRYSLPWWNNQSSTVSDYQLSRRISCWLLLVRQPPE